MLFAKSSFTDKNTTDKPKMYSILHGARFSITVDPIFNISTRSRGAISLEADDWSVIWSTLKLLLPAKENDACDQKRAQNSEE